MRRRCRSKQACPTLESLESRLALSTSISAIPATPAERRFQDQPPLTGGVSTYDITLNQTFEATAVAGQNTSFNGTNALANFQGVSDPTGFTATIDWGDEAALGLPSGTTDTSQGTITVDPRSPYLFDINSSHTYPAGVATTYFPTVTLQAPNGQMFGGAITYMTVNLPPTQQQPSQPPTQQQPTEPPTQQQPTQPAPPQPQPGTNTKTPLKGKVEIEKEEWKYNNQIHQFLKSALMQPAREFVESNNIHTKLSYRINYSISPGGGYRYTIGAAGRTVFKTQQEVADYNAVQNELNSRAAQSFNQFPALPASLRSYGNSATFSFNAEQASESTAKCPGM
jgi:hypothetical protein